MSIASPAYARLSRRISAVLIDSIFWAVMLFAVIYLVAQLGLQSPFGELAAVFIVTTIEPVLVSFTGGSVGHHLYGLRITAASNGERLGIVQSYGRFLVKVILGIISLITILTSKRHQAIHDLLCGSIVVYRNPDKQPPGYVMAEREDDEANYEYPSKSKRVVFIFLFYFLAYVMLTTGMLSLLSDVCLNSDRCSSSDTTVESLFSVVFVMSLFAIAWLGWEGMLPGCRKRNRQESA